ncbi:MULTISPECIES: hypothetical protein [unclassified Agrococcus]|uniref:hypothetical protein n=1 Tax=unclassified Agrococcus TaxID=2615065 RepID=UPI00360F3837
MVGVAAAALVAVPPVAFVVAATADDADRRTSALAVAIGGSALLVVAAVLAVVGRRPSAGPALLALAERDGLELTAWQPRRVEASRSLAVHVSQHDLDVLHGPDGVSWGTTTILAGGGRRLAGDGRAVLAFVDVALPASVPHALLADERSPRPWSVDPDAVGALELVPATPTPWRAWTTEPDAARAAAIVDPAVLAAIEEHAPDMELELVGRRALLTRRVDRAWRADDEAWLDAVDGIRIHVAPTLRAAAAAVRAHHWAPLPSDEPLGRSLRLALVRRALRDARVDAVLDVASSAS